MKKDSELSASDQKQQSVAENEDKVLKSRQTIDKIEAEQPGAQIQNYKQFSESKFHNKYNQLEAITISERLQQFLTNPSGLQIHELNILRDSMIETLLMISNELRNRTNVKEGKVNHRFMKDHYEGLDKSDAEKNALTALGLLMKHKGGAGMGHGRLVGEELELMELMLQKTVESFKH